MALRVCACAYLERAQQSLHRAKAHALVIVQNAKSAAEPVRMKAAISLASLIFATSIAPASATAAFATPLCTHCNGSFSAAFHWKDKNLTGMNKIGISDPVSVCPVRL